MNTVIMRYVLYFHKCTVNDDSVYREGVLSSLYIVHTSSIESADFSDLGDMSGYEHYL